LHRLANDVVCPDLLAFCDNGKAVITLGNSSVRAWDVALGKERPAIPATWGNCSAMSSDGKTLVTAEFKGTVLHVFNVDKGAETHMLEAEKVVSVCVSFDGKTIAAVGLDNVIRIWDAVTGKELKRIDAPLTFNGDVVPLARQQDVGCCSRG
jgi:WD40 repeat protein